MSRNWSYQTLGSANLKRRDYPEGTTSQDTTRSGLLEHQKTVARPDVVRTRKTKGWRPPTPWNVSDKDYYPWEGGVTYETRNVNDPPGKYSLTSVSGLIGAAGYLGGAAPAPLPTLNPHGVNEENRVLTQALLNVRNQKIQTMTVIAEVNKTTRMISSRLEKLLDAYRLARKGNFYGAQRVLGLTRKKAASSWLELSYGWVPLLVDIHGAYEAVRQRTIKDRMIVKGSSHYADDYEVWGVYSPSNYPWTLYTRDNVQRLTKVSLYYEYTCASLARASQVGLTNPLETAWELVPFSFVVDWLIPVGNYIGAQTAEHGTSFRGGSCTKRTVGTRKGFLQARPPVMVGSTKISFMAGSANLEGTHKSVVRTTYSVSPSPGLYIKNPFTSATRALNALALLKVTAKST